jgi:formylglycine-generating enzyme required for sulfatase activity
MRDQGAERQRRPLEGFKPNSIGLFDLGGNVWEWSLDTYKGDNSATGRDLGGAARRLLGYK